MKKKLLAVFSGICVLMACNKNNETRNGIKSTSDKILGKWQWVSSIEHYDYEEEKRDTIREGSGETLEFRNDGKCYSDHGNNKRDTVLYKIVDNSHFNFDYGYGFGYPIQINTLTDSLLVYHNKISQAAGYYEYTVTLKK